VRAFARQGADVGLIARGVDGLEGARHEVEAAGGRALVLPADVADHDAVDAAAGRVERELGPIDVWVNNAMVSGFSPVKEPQFDWVKSRLPHRAQPVPPIYAPEIAADAIVWASSHRRREMSVGAVTTAVIWGNKLAAGLGDRYLARTGYDSQQTDEPADPDQ